MDDRIVAFLKDILALEGGNANEVREGARCHLSVYEKQFRDEETDAYRQSEAAKRCRRLCRERVIDEINRRKGISTADLKLVLRVIDEPARFPLK